MPSTAPAPNNQKLRPTPTAPAGPGFVATNTQPVISEIIKPSNATVVGAIGQLGFFFAAARPAAPSKPSAAAISTPNVTQPIGANAPDALSELPSASWSSLTSALFDSDRHESGPAHS